jgi:hypothetical protein
MLGKRLGEMGDGERCVMMASGWSAARKVAEADEAVLAEV